MRVLVLEHEGVGGGRVMVVVSRRIQRGTGPQERDARQLGSAETVVVAL